MEDKKFETEVIARLTKIETKLDDYTSVKGKSEEAYSISKENEKEIAEINDKIKWITRLVIGAVIGGILALILK